MDLSNPELIKALEIARNNNLDISFNITSFPNNHPNTYRINAAAGKGEEMEFICLSTGGGMIEIQRINNLAVSICGDFHETLFFFHEDDSAALEELGQKITKLIPGYDYLATATTKNKGLINLKTGFKVEEQLKGLAEHPKLRSIITIEPVLPILSSKNCRVPFERVEEIISLAEKENLQSWELALRYESARGRIPAAETYNMARDLVRIMDESIRKGLAGTDYSNRILGPQAYKIQAQRSKLIGGRLTADIIANISAVMESKSAFGVIVAAPTAGSCGTLPGTLTALAADMKMDQDHLIKAVLAAGLIGILIARNSTFAAEENGCQAECGSASGMAAAGLVQMMGGSVRESLDAAAMALQNIMGMVCDPVAERVEVPCLGKNIMAGLNAVGCANMALAGFDRVIPLDETIKAMDSCGKMLPPELRCTGRGGLSLTTTAKEIYKRLNKHP